MFLAEIRIEYMKFIRQRLDKTNLRNFTESCFGQFLDVDTKHSQGQLMYLMYKHLDPKAIERHRISFIINDRTLELGPIEYFTITGLGFGGWEEPPSSSNFHNEIFGGEHKLFVKDIYKAFDTHSEKEKGKGETVLKLALLLVLYETLLVRHRTSKRIEVQYMHLIDDLERFNRFPWGLVSYQFLVIASHNAKLIIDRCLTEEGTKPVFDVYGFNFALQVFAYEVHKDIALYCAEPLGGASNTFPRMRRWGTKTFCHLNAILMYFEMSHATSLESMENTAEEIEKLASNDISKDMLCPVAIDKLFEHFKVLTPESLKPFKTKLSLGASRLAKRKKVKVNGEVEEVRCSGTPTVNLGSLRRCTCGFASSGYEESIPTAEDASSDPVLKLLNVVLDKFTIIENVISEIRSDIKSLENGGTSNAGIVTSMIIPQGVRMIYMLRSTYNLCW